MPHPCGVCQWGVLGHSQRGASHVRRNLPNQDAIAHYLADDGLPPVILAVADGHGGVKSFRSQVGSRLAVETAIEACREFLDGIQGAEPSAVKNDAELRIPPRIFQRWRRRVEEHFQKNPFNEGELARTAEQSGEAQCSDAARSGQIFTTYGSTLLLAVVTNVYLLCLQLGDGDIVAVSDGGRMVERVIPRDDTLIANETASLCQDDGRRYVRCRFQLFQNFPPDMLLLSTDGYSNSFASSDAFLKAGVDYFSMLRAEGPQEVQRGLPEWLRESSENGSGDDITVGIVYRRESALGHLKSRGPKEARFALLARLRNWCTRSRHGTGGIS